MNTDLSSCTSRPHTAAGAAYLKVALDPCGENLPVDFKGIPDGSEVDIVLLRMRDDMVLNPPSDLEGDETWGLIIFDTPYLLAQQIMVRYRDSVGPPTPLELREFMNGLSRNNMDAAVYPRWYRPQNRAVEAIVGLHYEITMAVETAGFEVSILKPSVLSDFDWSPAAGGWGFIRKFRFVGKGRTLHLNAPATATQGRVVSGQIGTESSVKVLVQDTDPVNLMQRVYPARFTVTPPFSFNNLPQQDLNARQDIIKTGSYDMQRHWNGSHIWNEVEDVRPIWRAPQSNLVGNWRLPITWINNLGSLENTDTLMKYDGFDVSLGWTVSHIDGMSGVASVHVKHRSMWEVNVPGTSPWAANKMAPCMHDPGALSLEKQLAPCLPHSFEARFNDMGLLASMLRGVCSVGRSFLAGGMNTVLNRYLPRKVVIDDPYAGPSLYGESGFVPARANGSGKNNGRKKKRGVTR